MTTPTTSTAPIGGEWLLHDDVASGVFTPERLSDEHRMIRQTVADFVNQEVLPQLDRLEAKDWTLSRDLIKRCGDLGLIGVDISEAYGGVGLDKVSSLIVSEQMATAASFGPTFGAQSNLTALPLVLFGTDAQKQHYLPRIVSGELVGAYCLSEPGSGSDALGARTRATRQPDGSFRLNGEKAWITNGGFADIFIVFAKIDDDASPGTGLFSAFIVERAFAGVTSGHEEHKMGLHGSSTTPIVFQDARVPAENLLGEIGKGHRIAFNVLNFARFKLGAMCVGGAQAAIGESSRYASERRQFGQPIANFGAIKHKLGEMVAQTYAAESLVYRTVGLIESHIASTVDSHGPERAMLAAFEAFAIEASIAKVFGSEVSDFVLDENIQIHGGNGFVRDYPAERHYRDSRVNRIFEGTNEINRLLIPGMLARRAAKGEIGIIPAALALQEELLGAPSLPPDDAGPLADERRTMIGAKKAALMVLGLAMQTYREALPDHQEVLMHTADMLIDVYAADSALLRATAAQGGGKAEWHAAAARVFVNDAAMRVEMTGRQVLPILAQGDILRTMLAAFRRLFKQMPIDGAALRRQLADEAVRRRGWIF